LTAWDTHALVRLVARRRNRKREIQAGEAGLGAFAGPTIDAAKRVAGGGIFTHPDSDIGYSGGTTTSLHIKDDETAPRRQACQAARRLETGCRADGRAAELDRGREAAPLGRRFAALRRTHPLPPPTGETTDEAFFDALSGER
jgi:antitoxin VapB